MQCFKKKYLLIIIGILHYPRYVILRLHQPLHTIWMRKYKYKPLQTWKRPRSKCVIRRASRHRSIMIHNKRTRLWCSAANRYQCGVSKFRTFGGSQKNHASHWQAKLSRLPESVAIVKGLKQLLTHVSSAVLAFSCSTCASPASGYILRHSSI